MNVYMRAHMCCMCVYMYAQRYLAARYGLAPGHLHGLPLVSERLSLRIDLGIQRNDPVLQHLQTGLTFGSLLPNLLVLGA